jgi:hypothetical protein
MFWFDMTFSIARVPLGKLCDNTVRLSGSAACGAEKLRLSAADPQKDRSMISLFDGFVSKIANENGLRSMQKSALTRGHPENVNR